MSEGERQVPSSRLTKTYNCFNGEEIMKYVTSADVLALIEKEVKNGQMFSMVFDRVAAKCPHCGKSNKKWNALERCPICGEVLSKERFTRAQLGVQNPANCTKPGQGQFIGESGEEALEKGRLKYFDMDVVNNDGTRGCYRQTRIDNIKRLNINHDEYLVIK